MIALINRVRNVTLKQDGFTLIELLIVVGVFGLIMLAIQSLLTSSMDVFYRENNDSNLRRQMYFAGETISREVRETVSAGIEIRDSDELALTSDGSTVRFYLQGSQIIRERDGQVRVIAESVEELRFTKPVDSRIIEIYIRVYSERTKQQMEINTGVTPRF